MNVAYREDKDYVYSDLTFTTVGGILEFYLFEGGTAIEIIE